MFATKNGVLERLTECRDPKMDFGGWRLVQYRREQGDFLKTMIKKTSNSLLKGRKTIKYEDIKLWCQLEGELNSK